MVMISTTDTEYMIEEIKKLEIEMEKLKQIREQYRVLERLIINQLKLDFVDFATKRLLEIDDQEKQKIIIQLIQKIQANDRYISYTRIQFKLERIKEYISGDMDKNNPYIIGMIEKDERNSDLNRYRKPVD